MANAKRFHELKERRHKRIRRKVTGTPLRPRLSVFRSNRHIVAQVIDDTSGHTLVAASSLEVSFPLKPTGNIAAATEVGRLVAQRAKEQGVNAVVFDRGGARYHGRVAALAEAARKAGLEL
jgi:large subunit ribosomal protein L18